MSSTACVDLVLTFSINLTRETGGHEPTRWIRALIKACAVLFSRGMAGFSGLER
jgi:hypothetical protein